MAKKTTVEEVLTCDTCGEHIDEIGLAMVFWWLDETKEGEDRPRVSRLIVGHKRPECSAGPHLSERSAELGWYASPAAGLNRLSSMTYDYQLTSEQLERLIEVAWAVPSAATPAEVAGAEPPAGEPEVVKGLEDAGAVHHPQRGALRQIRGKHLGQTAGDPGEAGLARFVHQREHGDRVPGDGRGEHRGH